MRKWGQRGSILLLTALSLPVFMTSIGLAVDVGNVYLHHVRLQNTADAAALAGATTFWQLAEQAKKEAQGKKQEHFEKQIEQAVQEAEAQLEHEVAPTVELAKKQAEQQVQILMDKKLMEIQAQAEKQAEEYFFRPPAASSEKAKPGQAKERVRALQQTKSFIAQHIAKAKEELARQMQEYIEQQGKQAQEAAGKQAQEYFLAQSRQAREELLLPKPEADGRAGEDVAAEDNPEKKPEKPAMEENAAEPGKNRPGEGDEAKENADPAELACRQAEAYIDEQVRLLKAQAEQTAQEQFARQSDAPIAQVKKAFDAHVEKAKTEAVQQEQEHLAQKAGDAEGRAEQQAQKYIGLNSGNSADKLPEASYRQEAALGSDGPIYHCGIQLSEDVPLFFLPMLLDKKTQKVTVEATAMVAKTRDEGTEGNAEEPEIEKPSGREAADPSESAEPLYRPCLVLAAGR